MIPVFGVPILNGVEHLEAMHETIDAEVQQFVYVDNGDVLPDEPSVIKPRYNMGVAAAWNAIIKATPWAEYWIISNHDKLFAPGELDKLAEETEKGGLVMLGGFSTFGVHRFVIQEVGWFDEGFHPAFYEDNDMDYRCRLAGVSLTALPSASQHRNSSTLKDEPLYAKQNMTTFNANRERYRAKWGGDPYREQYKTPFDDPNASIRDTFLDIDLLARQQWDRVADK